MGGRIQVLFTSAKVAGVVLQRGVACILAFTGTFQQIITYTAFPNYAFLTLGVVSLIVLRRREPDLPRIFRVPLYPFTPLLFIAIFGLYLVNSLQHSFRDTMVGIVLTLAGLPLYFYWTRPSRAPRT